MTPVLEMDPEPPSTAQSRLSTTIDVEEAQPKEDKPKEEVTKPTTGPKPAKTVEPSTINLSAFAHFAPKKSRIVGSEPKY